MNRIEGDRYAAGAAHRNFQRIGVHNLETQHLTRFIEKVERACIGACNPPRCIQYHFEQKTDVMLPRQRDTDVVEFLEPVNQFG
jgi:hypothetical protein